ncbi:hypothetical protein J6590_046786 [Homalodisca vitripennis]|nr:hypothetical protein J6590_046786 [Homalodisca vitripennis]
MTLHLKECYKCQRITVAKAYRSEWDRGKWLYLFRNEETSFIPDKQVLSPPPPPACPQHSTAQFSPATSPDLWITVITSPLSSRVFRPLVPVYALSSFILT